MIQRIVQAIGGRHYTMAIWFALTGFVLAWHGTLGVPYVMLAGALQAMVAGRSIATDYFDHKNREDDK